MKTKKHFWYNWIITYSFGELLALSATGVIGRSLFIGVSGKALTTFSSIAILIVAGSIEGLLIGYAQWKSLSTLLPHLHRTPWLSMTMLSTVIGWLLILPPGIMLLSFLYHFTQTSNSHIILYIAFIGLAFGGLIGIPQFFLIRKYLSNAVLWILATALAWTFSFLIIYLIAFLIAVPASGIYNLMLIIASCILSGLVQGIVTGVFLHLLMSVKNERKGKPTEGLSPLAVLKN